eukprot:6455593-Amphidinium_carterae.6
MITRMNLTHLTTAQEAKLTEMVNLGVRVRHLVGALTSQDICDQPLPPNGTENALQCEDYQVTLGVRYARTQIFSSAQLTPNRRLNNVHFYRIGIDDDDAAPPMRGPPRQSITAPSSSPAAAKGSPIVKPSES